MAEVLKVSCGDTHRKIDCLKDFPTFLAAETLVAPLMVHQSFLAKNNHPLGFGECQYGARGVKNGVLSGKVEFCRTSAPSFFRPRPVWGLGLTLKDLWQSPHVCTHSGCSDVERKKSVHGTNKILNKYYCPHEVVEGAVWITPFLLTE